jgi:hypothetical protein
VYVLERVHRWLVGIAALHERPPAEREELRHLHPVLRGLGAVSIIVDVYALTRVAPRDVPTVAALVALYAIITLVPPTTGPLGLILSPRGALSATIALLWSPLYTLIGVAWGTLVGVLVFRLYEPWRAVLNTINWAYPLALASIAGHAVFRAIPDPLLGLTAAGVAIVTVYVITNRGVVALSHHVRFGVPFFDGWWTRLKDDPMGAILQAPLAIFLGAIALGHGSNPWIVLLLTCMAALTIPSARAQDLLYAASQRTTRDIVQALMLALDRTVPGTRAHAERTSLLVTGAGRRLRISARTLETWGQASLLHDVGLIDTHNRSAGPQARAAAGARILAYHPDPGVAEIVRVSGTARFGGTVKGRRSAALGARVLAAAEKYDELRYGTIDNPGLGTHAAAAAALCSLVGSELDPLASAAVLEAAAERERRSSP